ncbi:hypothetical protein PCE1_000099 [Barthelona sp. PCE]
MWSDNPEVLILLHLLTNGFEREAFLLFRQFFNQNKLPLVNVGREGQPMTFDFIKHQSLQLDVGAFGDHVKSFFSAQQPLFQVAAQPKARISELNPQKIMLNMPFASPTIRTYNFFRIDQPYEVCYDPNHTTVVVYQISTGIVRIFDTDTCELLANLYFPEKTLVSIDYHPCDRSKLFVCTVLARRLYTINGEFVAEFTNTNNKHHYGLIYGPLSKNVFLATCSERILYIYDVPDTDTQQYNAVFTHLSHQCEVSINDDLTDHDFHPNGRILATLGADGSVAFWDLNKRGCYLKIHLINHYKDELTNLYGFKKLTTYTMPKYIRFSTNGDYLIAYGPKEAIVLGISGGSVFTMCQIKTTTLDLTIMNLIGCKSQYVLFYGRKRVKGHHPNIALIYHIETGQLVNQIDLGFDCAFINIFPSSHGREYNHFIALDSLSRGRVFDFLSAKVLYSFEILSKPVETFFIDKHLKFCITHQSGYMSVVSFNGFVGGFTSPLYLAVDTDTIPKDFSFGVAFNEERTDVVGVGDFQFKFPNPMMLYMTERQRSLMKGKHRIDTRALHERFTSICNDKRGLISQNTGVNSLWGLDILNSFAEPYVFQCFLFSDAPFNFQDTINDIEQLPPEYPSVHRLGSETIMTEMSMSQLKGQVRPGFNIFAMDLSVALHNARAFHKAQEMAEEEDSDSENEEEVDELKMLQRLRANRTRHYLENREVDELEFDEFGDLLIEEELMMDDDVHRRRKRRKSTRPKRKQLTDLGTEALDALMDDAIADTFSHTSEQQELPRPPEKTFIDHGVVLPVMFEKCFESNVLWEAIDTSIFHPFIDSRVSFLPMLYKAYVLKKYEEAGAVELSMSSAVQTLAINEEESNELELFHIPCRIVNINMKTVTVGEREYPSPVFYLRILDEDCSQELLDRIGHLFVEKRTTVGNTDPLMPNSIRRTRTSELFHRDTIVVTYHITVDAFNCGSNFPFFAELDAFKAMLADEELRNRNKKIFSFNHGKGDSHDSSNVRSRSYKYGGELTQEIVNSSTFFNKDTMELIYSSSGFLAHIAEFTYMSKGETHMWRMPVSTWDMYQRIPSTNWNSELTPIIISELNETNLPVATFDHRPQLPNYDINVIHPSYLDLIESRVMSQFYNSLRHLYFDIVIIQYNAIKYWTGRRGDSFVEEAQSVVTHLLDVINTALVNENLTVVRDVPQRLPDLASFSSRPISPSLSIQHGTLSDFPYDNIEKEEENESDPTFTFSSEDDYEEQYVPPSPIHPPQRSTRRKKRRQEWQDNEAIMDVILGDF